VSGDVLTARAKTTSAAGKKRTVAVEIMKAGVPVFRGEFTCVVPDRHVMEGAQ